MSEPTPAPWPEGIPQVDLAAYVRASDRDATFVDESATRAAWLVSQKVTGHDVPQAILEAAVLEVGANLYGRRVSRIGTPSFGDPETMGNPMRPALDPLTPAWPILRPYLGPGLA